MGRVVNYKLYNIMSTQMSNCHTLYFLSHNSHMHIYIRRCFCIKQYVSHGHNPFIYSIYNIIVIVLICLSEKPYTVSVSTGWILDVMVFCGNGTLTKHLLYQASWCHMFPGYWWEKVKASYSCCDKTLKYKGGGRNQHLTTSASFLLACIKRSMSS